MMLSWSREAVRWASRRKRSRASGFLPRLRWSAVAGPESPSMTDALLIETVASSLRIETTLWVSLMTAFEGFVRPREAR